jgi:tetratricopeptide (TPR) repeat protein
MAYIKLLRFTAAVNDCSACIQRDPKNVKAFWRRFIALKSLGRYADARKDIEHALVLEPTNQSFKADLKSLLETIDNPPRRRIPIEEIGQPVVKPVNVTKTVKSIPITETIAENAASKPQPLSERSVPVHSITTAANNSAVPACPKTVFEFERDWKMVQQSPERIYAYLRQIQVTQFPMLFKSCLQSSHLSLFIKVLAEYYLKNEGPHAVYSFLEHLSKTERFQMNLMFLNSRDKQGKSFILYPFVL